jgi:hypothetical protein
MLGVRLGDGLAACDVGDVLVLLWKSPPNLQRWAWNFAEIERLAFRHREGVIVLDLLLESSTAPDAVTRGRMQRDLRKLGLKLRRLVVVPLGNSLWTSLVRTMVRALLLLSGQASRQVVVGTVAEGLAAVAKAGSAHTPSERVIEGAIGDLYRALGVEPKIIAA